MDNRIELEQVSAIVDSQHPIMKRIRMKSRYPNITSELQRVHKMADLQILSSDWRSILAHRANTDLGLFIFTPSTMLAPKALTKAYAELVQTGIAKDYLHIVFPDERKTLLRLFPALTNFFSKSALNLLPIILHPEDYNVTVLPHDVRYLACVT